MCDHELLFLTAGNQRSKSQTGEVIRYKVWSCSLDNEWESCVSLQDPQTMSPTESKLCAMCSAEV